MMQEKWGEKWYLDLQKSYNYISKIHFIIRCKMHGYVQICSSSMKIKFIFCSFPVVLPIDYEYKNVSPFEFSLLFECILLLPSTIKINKKLLTNIKHTLRFIQGLKFSYNGDCISWIFWGCHYFQNFLKLIMCQTSNTFGSKLLILCCNIQCIKCGKSWNWRKAT